MKRPTTIIVHGSLFPVISKHLHGVYCPEGISLAKDLPSDNTLSKMATTLCEASPGDFNEEKLYVFGWSGALSSEDRKNAAKKLLEWMLEHSNEEFVLIGHSHGGNVLLNLAEIVHEREKIPFTIQKLVLLACPVQKETAHLITSMLFQKVYSLYSSKDFAQICDPTEYLYHIIPVLSERVFEPADKVLQSELSIEGSPLDHNDFLLSELFVAAMPLILKELDIVRGDIMLDHKNRFRIDILNNHQLICNEILDQK